MNIKNKGLWLFFLSCIWGVPVHASLGDDINALIDTFFGDDKRDEPALDNPMPPVIVPVLDLPKDPTPEDLAQLKADIVRQEAELSTVEDGIRFSQGRAQALDRDQHQLESQIMLLDQELSITNKKLSLLLEQETNWKQTLEALTREKHELTSRLRVVKREWNRDMNTKIVRAEVFGLSEETALIQWIFSPKTVSQILEEQHLSRQHLASQEQDIYQLELLERSLSGKEQKAAFLLAHVSTLRQRIREQHVILKRFTDQKAQLLTELRKESGKEEKSLIAHQYQQEELSLYLRSLYEGQQKIENKISSLLVPDQKLFQPPLAGDLLVTAGFHDAAYQAAVGKVHEGIDWEVVSGTPVLAASSGTVKKISHTGLGYSYVILDHGEGLYTIYGHLSKILILEDQAVEVGDRIALTGGDPGSEGAGAFTTGPHLHFEVFHGGEYQDPASYFKSEK